MLGYKRGLKPLASRLRTNMTDAEQLLWSRLRRKQIAGLQFYRQRPLAGFIVDFYCHAAKLAIELDGGQHFDVAQSEYDAERTRILEALGLRVLRFSNKEVFEELEAVLEQIYCAAWGNPP